MSNTTTCPSCLRPLRIPDTLVGQQAKCPACGTIFLAKLDPDPPTTPASAPSAPPGEPESKPAPPPAPARDRENRRPDEDRPVRRRREEDDEDDDYDDRPRRKRRDNFVDHRGGLILALGICSFVMSPIPFGQIAWWLGNNDMAEIRAGRMDPEGEGLTQIGRILGMVSSLMALFFLLLGCLGFCLIFGLTARAGAIFLLLSRMN